MSDRVEGRVKVEKCAGKLDIRRASRLQKESKEAGEKRPVGP